MKTSLNNRFLLPALIVWLGVNLAAPLPAQTFTTLHSFSALSGAGNTNSDGSGPQAGLLLSGNTLYGTASGGGTSDAGTVFAVNRDGTGFRTLYSFTATIGTLGHSTRSLGTNSDGARPYAGLILSGNTLYGTAYGGGSGGNGTVFAVNTDGTGFTNLHSFSATDPKTGSNSDGAGPQALILSGNTLYAAADGGGTLGRGTVFALNTNGTGFRTVHTFFSDSNYQSGVYPNGSLILSGDILYGTTLGGSAQAYGTVFALNTNGAGFTTLFDFTNGSDGFFPESGLVLSGNTLYGTTVAGGNGGNSGRGTVFAVNTDGTGFTNLYSFTATPIAFPQTNSHGAAPWAGLILAGNTLYGTAVYGGPSGYGTMFALNTNGTGFTNLYSFTNGSDGGLPYAGFILSGNSLYGTASSGGSSGDGTVFALSGVNLAAPLPAQTFTTLYSFTGGSDGANPAAGLLLSGNTLYGTANFGGFGGSSGNGTVFAVNTNGTGFVTLHIFTAFDPTYYTNSDGGRPLAGLILSGNTLYGTTFNGGGSGNGTVFAVNTDGTGFMTLHSFTAITGLINADGNNPFAGLILSGNTLYGTAWAGGSGGNGTVFAVNTNGTGFTNLHSFTATTGFGTGADGWGINSDGARPFAGLILSGNTLYGTAWAGGSGGNGTVFAVKTDGTGFTALYTFTAGTGSSNTAITNSDGAAPQAGLLLSGNTLYGTAKLGGSSGDGTVFAVNTDGTGFMTLYSFTGGSDGASPAAGLILSGNTLYGTAQGGGSSGNGTVFALTLSVVSLQFTANPTSGAAPLTVLFSSPGVDSAGNAITSWNWTFGDGSTSTAQNPLHTYAAAGNFSPSLTVTNSSGQQIPESGPSITVSPPPPIIVFTANPTSGLIPLTVSFTAADVDSAGNAITLWYWRFGDGSTSAAQNPSHLYTTPGPFFPTLIATNDLGGMVSGFGPALIIATNAPGYSGLVLNGGFETSDFTGWTLSGSASNNIDVFVDNGSQSGISPHSGSYLAALGSVGSLSSLSQTLATSAGAAYWLSLWLDSPDGQTPNEFLVSWNGNTLFDAANLPATGWTNLQFLVSAAGKGTVLEFGFRDDPSYFGLDDVSIWPAQFSIGGIQVSGKNLVFTGVNGLSGGIYSVMTSTNLVLPLSQWTRVATNVLSTNGNFTITVTNAMTSGASQQFYMLQLQ